MDAYQAYMREVSQPMRDELTNNGFKELTTEEEVDQFMANAKGSSLVLVNSVCGCAGGLARPAVIYATNEGGIKPDNMVTVFAGQDREATAKMREYFGEIPPSSPSVAILEDNKVKHFIPREDIEGADPDTFIQRILSSFE
ncbi:putative bacilliredoxin, YphP/YqiW family [Amphibacillus marinus]|uniref:Putative bacilliredoxin, YphP/YqiW family n=1 Tax=Amphibacillus marinus TaxID=872970 RepID=A0A1H8RW96_9BACI|nr:BrxA/BrxB family bacilliredoxin [Amphibacillus marinus]SEO70464.1 putative bacilliredoxin, YphP/YqiW family [Amphibacillus marinus]